MLINVPQYIDVEDKVAGPLTFKQLGWLLAMGIILLIVWNMVPFPGSLVVGFPVAVVFVALAFFKPYGQPLGSFVIFGIMYFFRPKIYVWKRAPENIISVPQKAPKTENFVQEKHLTSESLHDLAQLLDSEGTNYNEKIVEILKKPPVKKS